MSDELHIDAGAEPSKPAGNQPQAEPVGEQGNQGIVSTETSRADSTDVSRGTTTPDEGVLEYTPEELSKLALEQVDIARVPENARAFYEKGQKEKKELQADYTRKSQELAEMKKSQAQQLPPTKDPMERINRAYQANNEAEMGRVFGEYNQAISQINEALLNEEAKDPFSPKIVEMKKVLFRLDKESKLLQGHVYNLKQQTTFIDNLNRDSRAEIVKEVPDFEKKDPEYYRFSKAELGLDDDTIHSMTDAVAWTQVFQSRGYPNAAEMGKRIPAMIMKAVGKMYDRFNVGKEVQTKIKEPVPLARGGALGNVKNKAIKDYSDSDIELEINRIKFGG